MGLIFDLITLPLLAGPRLVHWMASKTVEEAQRELLDEGRVRGELMELQQRYEAGDLDEGEYDRQEKVLLEHLNAIREFTRQLNEQR